MEREWTWHMNNNILDDPSALAAVSEDITTYFGINNTKSLKREYEKGIKQSEGL